MQRETLVEQLREGARVWARLTIAQNLLDRTRQKFETERQPRVIQHASAFFSRITGQRYRRLYVPMGERSVPVEDHDGAIKLPHQLSRGTREQLYLALRFGLVREFGEHVERLPVVVDEALVNFDPERARLAAECLPGSRKSIRCWYSSAIRPWWTSSPICLEPRSSTWTQAARLREKSVSH